MSTFSEVVGIFTVAVGIMGYTFGGIIMSSTGTMLRNQKRRKEEVFLIVAQMIAGMYAILVSFLVLGPSPSCFLKSTTARVWFSLSRFCTTSATMERLTYMNETKNMMRFHRLMSFIVGSSSTLVTIVQITSQNSDDKICGLIPHFWWFTVVVFLQPMLLIICATRLKQLTAVAASSFESFQNKEKYSSSSLEEKKLSMAKIKNSAPLLASMLGASAVIIGCSLVVGVSTNPSLLLISMVGDVCWVPGILTLGLKEPASPSRKPVSNFDQATVTHMRENR